VQRLAVDGGLLAIATLQDGLLPVEHVADVTGRTSHVVVFGDVETVVFWFRGSYRTRLAQGGCSRSLCRIVIRRRQSIGASALPLLLL